MKKIKAFHISRTLNELPESLENTPLGQDIDLDIALDILGYENAFDIVSLYDMHNDDPVIAALAETTKVFFERTIGENRYKDEFDILCKLAEYKNVQHEELVQFYNSALEIHNSKDKHEPNQDKTLFNYDLLATNMLIFTFKAALKAVNGRPNYQWFKNSGIFKSRKMPMHCNSRKAKDSILSISSVLYNKKCKAMAEGYIVPYSEADEILFKHLSLFAKAA
tara:strand:+ start:681 stop:1346 length:666 start_codon:yes stop_codon:yes gene_type:complete